MIISGKCGGEEKERVLSPWTVGTYPEYDIAGGDGLALARTDSLCRSVPLRRNSIEMTGVRHGVDLFMFEVPHEEVWSVDLVSKSDTLK